MRFLIFFIGMSDVAEMDSCHFKWAEGQTPFNNPGVWSYFFFFSSLQCIVHRRFIKTIKQMSVAGQ